MKHLSRQHIDFGDGPSEQRGLVLFFALIALVAMSLAAVALVRSVDTTTLIAGNLAFRQSTTSSGDSGTEAAIGVLAATEAANSGKNVFTDATHAFNVTSAATGYYSNADPALVLTANSTWTDLKSSPAVIDASGNTYRYIIQRMCRTENLPITTTNCLFSAVPSDTGEKGAPLPPEICAGVGCPKGGQSPLYRVTVRITGPKNTISYIQSVVY